MAEANVIVEKRDAVGILTLNRPQEMNTFNVAMARELNDGLWAFERDPQVRVVVIRGNGAHFSTGIALNEFKNKTHAEYRDFLSKMDEQNHTLARMKKPVIASVHGYALANGAGLSFACDLTVAADTAKFGTTAINVGLICLGPAVPMLRSLGRKKTLEMVLTGDIISATEAERLGLVNKVVPEAELEEATMKLANKLADKSYASAKRGSTRCRMSLTTRPSTTWTNFSRRSPTRKMPRKAGGRSSKNGRRNGVNADCNNITFSSDLGFYGRHSLKRGESVQ